MDILTSLIQFITLCLGITVGVSIAVKTHHQVEDISANMMILFGFCWAVFIYITFLM